MTIVMVKGRALRELILAELPNQAAIRKASPSPGNAIAEAVVQASTLPKEGRSILTPEQVERFKEMGQHPQKVLSNKPYRKEKRRN